MRRHPARTPIFLGLTVVALWTSIGAGAAEVDPATARRILAGQLGLTRKLVGTLAAGRSGGNVVVSPASVAGMLSAVDLGAGPAMHGDVLKVLGIAPGPAAESDLAALREAAARNTQGDELSTATRLVFDRTLHPSAEGLARLTRAGIGGDTMDLHAPSAVGDINAWVSRVTRGKIPSIVDGIDRDDRMIALNALYFRGRWEHPFEASQTQPADFTAASGRRTRVPFMHGKPRLAEVRQDDRFVAVDLPFQDGRFQLVVLTTRGAQGETADFADHLDWLDGAGFIERPVALDLPRFEARAKQSLLPALSAMGLNAAHPFTGFATDRLVLSDVLQAADLSVDEKGAEVAIATAGGFHMTAGIIFRDVIDVTLDRPFAFALREARAGLILVSGFMGEIEGTAVAEDAPHASACSPFVAASVQTAIPGCATDGVGRRSDAPGPKTDARPESDTLEKRLRLERDF